MRVEVTELTTKCIVGAYDRERDVPQPLHVDLRLELDVEAADWAAADPLLHSIDYAAVSREVAFILNETRFRYLESAAYALAHYLLLPREQGAAVTRVEVCLRKPAALEGVGVPKVSLTLRSDELKRIQESKPWGNVDVIWESKQSGIYRLNLEPGKEIPLHHHLHLDESEMILGPRISTSGTVLPTGAAIRWSKAQAHRHRNVGTTVQSILCVDRPRFVASDEVEVDGEAASFEWALPPFSP